MPGGSTVNQLAFLYNTLCQSLDAGKEVRIVFCDITKAFDRVWHSGLLLKFQAAGVTGEVQTASSELFFQAQYLIGHLFKPGFPNFRTLIISFIYK